MHDLDEKEIKHNDLEKLRKEVEFTRKNRINASTRLLNKERFVQSINIYYSCVAAIVTVLSLIFPERSFGIASAVLTVILAISIVYLNAQKYGERAQQLKTNYISLQQLIFDIENDQRIGNISEMKKFTDRYIELLQTSENHISYDHQKTLHLKDIVEGKKAKRDGRKPKSTKRLSGKEKLEYWYYEISHIILKAVFWFAPIAYFIYEIHFFK